MARGIDVSNNNGHIDWSGIREAGYTYAIAKATEGTSFVDQFYDSNRAAAKAEGLHFGAYHFFSPGEDAAAQVDFFLRHAQPTRGDIVPTLDYEQTPADRAPAEAFVSALRRETDHWPMFYSYQSFITSMRVPASSPLAHCPLWLAGYSAARPAPPAPWHEIVIWQHTSSGRVAGIGGNVDLDQGSPPLSATKNPITHYHLTYHDAQGKRHERDTKHPILWQIRYKKVRRHGRLVQDPVRKS